MRLCKQSTSYATEENAVRALAKALGRMNRSTEDVRWMIVANGEGRFVPVIVPATDSEIGVLMPLINHGVSLVR